MNQNRELIPTRMTLIERLKRWDDGESWRDFFDTYWKLIHTVALKSGLSEDEAQEVVQETVISVSKNIGKFKADPTFGSFKSWLLQLTRWRINDQFRNRSPEQRRSFSRATEVPRDRTATSTSEQVQDPSGSSLEAIWEEEWRGSLLKAALEKVQRRVSAKHYQIFYAHVIEEMPVTKVARMFGTNAVKVYVVKHRLSLLLKKAIKEIETSGS